MGMPQIFNGVDEVYTAAQTHGLPDGPQFAVGTVAVDPRTGATYMLCKNMSGTSSALGAPAYEDTGNVKGQVGKAADATNAVMPIGPWMGVVVTLGFGWVQLTGRAVCLGDGSVADGEPVFATADTYDTATIGTHHISGIARELDGPTFTCDLVPVGG